MCEQRTHTHTQRLDDDEAPSINFQVMQSTIANIIYTIKIDLIQYSIMLFFVMFRFVCFFLNFYIVLIQ